MVQFFPTIIVTGEIKYVGRTTNATAREAQHASSVDKGHLQFKSLKEGVTYEQARGLEQLYFNQYGGFNSLINKIRPISPTNPNYDLYINAASEVK